MSYNAITSGYASAVAASDIRSTTVDSVNAHLDALRSRADGLQDFARRVVDGLIGVAPPEPQTSAGNMPVPVLLSTQDHLRALEEALDRLAWQLHRLS